jgi:phosphate transport system substrate-binding protein
MKMKPIFRSLFFIFSLGVMAACNNAPSSDQNTILTGRSVIYVDETLAPIVKEQVDVFQYSYKHAEISLVNVPENLVVDALLKDSTEIVVLTRLLNEKELSYFRARQFKPRVTKFATDAIALVIHKESTDTLIRVEDLIDVMQGRSSKVLVFDNANSSTVRFLKEIAEVDSLPKSGIYGLKSNLEVLQYTASHKGAIGVVGVNWLLKPDSLQQAIKEMMGFISLPNLILLRAFMHWQDPFI